MCLVLCEFQKLPCEDYGETFAPVVKFFSLRMMLAVAAYEDLELHHLDAKNSFMNGYPNKDIYMEQSEGFVDPEKPKFSGKLQKALFGLNHAPRK